MKVYIKYEDNDFVYEIELKTILKKLRVKKTEEDIAAAARQAVIES